MKFRVQPQYNLCEAGAAVKRNMVGQAETGEAFPRRNTGTIDSRQQRDSGLQNARMPLR